jgi:radical SAM superfamily enzyme YgiQ (UPF0313 family)
MIVSKVRHSLCPPRRRLRLCVPNAPRSPANTNRLYTLGLLYLRAAAERVGWDVRLVDAYFANLSHDNTVAAVMTNSPPAVIGFTINSFEMSVVAESILREIRRTSVGLPPISIAGGYYASREPARLLHGSTGFDIVVRGEGEDALQEILSAVGNGRRPIPSPSILLCGEGGIIGGTGRLQGRSVLDEIGDFDIGWLRSEVAPEEWSLVTSRGCSAACAFCTIGPHWGRYREWRGHSAEWIHANMQRMAEYGARYIQLVDDQFVGNAESVERAHRLVDLLEHRPVGVPFYILCRADTVIENPLLFTRLARVGLDTVFLGLESGNDETLQLLQKQHTVAQGEAAVAILDRAGMNTVGGTIIFYPWMTEASLRVELAFFRKLLDRYKRFYFYDLNELDIFSNTAMGARYTPFDQEGCHRWHVADRPMQDVWNVWQAGRHQTIFPAMQCMPLQRNVPLRRALCVWQLHWLERVLDRVLRRERRAAILRDMYVSMAEFVLNVQGRNAINQFLSAAHVPVEPEHCFG